MSNKFSMFDYIKGGVNNNDDNFISSKPPENKNSFTVHNPNMTVEKLMEDTNMTPSEKEKKKKIALRKENLKIALGKFENLFNHRNFYNE